jgi:nucleotide-binding universal stress UspA family protein
MERIGVGLDGSPISTAALDWASRIAVATGAEIVAINGFVEPFSEVSPELHERLIAERETALGAAWIAPAINAGVSVRTKLAEGDPRDVVLSVAEEESVDLLVLGRTGAGGGPGFMHLGSLVEHAAHHSGIPVAVVPAGWASSVGSMVLGVDGSPESAGAVGWATMIASRLGAAVTAVYVEEPIAEWTLASSPKNWRRDAERHIEEWTEPLREAGIQVNLIVQADIHPADALLGVAGARHADLLVIGTRGLGGFLGLRAGGVALKMLHRARLPLVLVPPT